MDLISPHIPDPIDLNALRTLYSSNRALKQRQIYVFNEVESILDHPTLPGELAINTTEKETIDLYCEYRAWISFSEALNRIWTTVELHKKDVNNSLELREFNIGFSNSSTIPNLHYANMALLLSYLVAIGVIPIRKNERENWFLVRQDSSYRAYAKGDYVQKLRLSTSSKNWHELIIALSQRMAIETQSDLPIDKVDCVRKARNYLHYSLLSSSSLLAQIGELYYGKCLSVSKQLCSAVFNILTSDIGLQSQNQSEKRFQQLMPECSNLITRYSNSASIITLQRKVPCLANLP